MEHSPPTGPLAGLRVLELGQLIAGPFATKTLADLGADVIKVEPPGTGDPLRQWRLLHEGTSVWWEVQSRNKRSVAIDLRHPQGQALVRDLAAGVDILVENFRPGTLEGWDMSYEALSARNPGLILLRISGFGQTGPYRDQPGFGVVGEAMGGLRHLTGQPGEVPVRVGVSIGDTLAALHGTIGLLSALHERSRNGGKGQVVDVALYEAVFNCMESLLPEYSAFGAVREPAGSALPGITPSNAYPCLDGWVLVAGNGDSIFKRLMQAIGRQDLGEDPDLAHNDGRSRRASEIDAAIGAWTQTLTITQVLETLQRANVPGGRIYTVADIARDPHYRARDMILSTTTATGLALEVPGIVPKLSRTPGNLRRRAPRLGEDTDAVLGALGLDEAALRRLREEGVIA
ncbi:MAG: CoA transferase [Betaproteobacteria bacterium]|nr:CoA transferase [Betaproteobacteria bacterium]MDE2623191.1 CoA transferase [Betaproteobacteria bacterium]